jgi:hypothetical protein
MFRSLTAQLSEDVAKQVFTALVREQFSALPMSLRMLGTFYVTRLVPPELINAEDLAAIREATALGRTPFKSVLPRLKGRPDSLFQGVIQRRYESQWPVTEDLRNALLAILGRTGVAYKDVPSLVGELVRDIPSYQQATLLLPVALAIGSAGNALGGFLSNSALVRSARILRNFDRTYFEDAYRTTFVACMAAGLHANYQWTE